MRYDSNQSVSIVYAADDNYSRLAGVSIYSLLSNNKHMQVDIYILNDCITEDNKERL